MPVWFKNGLRNTQSQLELGTSRNGILIPLTVGRGGLSVLFLYRLLLRAQRFVWKDMTHFVAIKLLFQVMSGRTYGISVGYLRGRATSLPSIIVDDHNSFNLLSVVGFPSPEISLVEWRPTFRPDVVVVFLRPPSAFQATLMSLRPVMVVGQRRCSPSASTLMRA